MDDSPPRTKRPNRGKYNYVFEPFLYLVGYVFLALRYRKRDDRIRCLQEKYENDYASVGSYILLSSFGVSFLILLLSFIVILIYSSIKFGIK